MSALGVVVMELMCCFVCKHDGTRICDLAEAELRCTICGKCAAERPVCFGTNPSQVTQEEYNCIECHKAPECLL